MDINTKRKQRLLEKFNHHFNPNGDKRLLAVHLNGFTHSIIFDGGSSETPISQLDYSAYTNVNTDDDYINHKLALLFSGLPHYENKHNPVEYVYVMPNER